MSNETQAAPGTTNDDAPFQPGERVERRNGERATVLCNDGGMFGEVRLESSGRVNVWVWRQGPEIPPVRRVSP